MYTVRDSVGFSTFFVLKMKKHWVSKELFFESLFVGGKVENISKHHIDRRFDRTGVIVLLLRSWSLFSHNVLERKLAKYSE